MIKTIKGKKTFFETVTLIGEITNHYAREKGTRVYFLKGATQSVNDILREEIKKRKKQ